MYTQLINEKGAKMMKLNLSLIRQIKLPIRVFAAGVCLANDNNNNFNYNKN